MAVHYTAAWCRHDAAGVAGFYAPQGSLRVNDSPAAVGREAIRDVAQSFMSAFPDLQVILDDVLAHAEGAVYRWTLLGRNTGPSGTGHAVRISGYEQWRLDNEGFIAQSEGHFDQTDYRRQIEQGPDVQD